ncbi:MAG: tRNA uridine-5-carboxymethylaminomethyl(34) synthesis enzyme MnmG [Planctomycetia bacterium]|nr:tRNA uridine-5-carboxymethylaminomethyl(34) synthesis enzyme MnmG [Planctomycetia bacterium]
MQFDILVIGGGHAGAEAAAAAARLGAKTCLLSSNLDSICAMSCNPAIGGVAKGQIVREVDALGGLMGEVIDATGIQFRMLNRSKGPAMHGPRAQADKKAYQFEMKYRLECLENLSLVQQMVESLILEERSGGQAGGQSGALYRVCGVRTQMGEEYLAPRVVLTTGTFLRGALHYGPTIFPGGRSGEAAAEKLSLSLLEAGIRLERFKTGTPARIHAKSLDYSRLQIHPGDADPRPFSFLHDKLEVEQVPCWITRTNQRVHEIIRANLHQAPMYSGQIQSTGPRYCPSIETKVVRFSDKESHQLYLEPEGRRTHEVYINGLSTSLPCDIQREMIHACEGLENAQIMRYAYAIEYDYAPPEQLRPTLETKCVEGLFFAGQINGTTGYEEAAGQGLLAGTNAVRTLGGREPIILKRSKAYLGVMIDDLVTKGVDEPYRMFTSRAEHRLRLRGDNADRRLTPLGHELGLIDARRWESFREKMTQLEELQKFLQEKRVKLAQTCVSAEEYLRRPESKWADLVARFPELERFSPQVCEQAEFDAKYSGYLSREDAAVERSEKLGRIRIPDDFDFLGVEQLRMEAKEQFARVRPTSIDQASRIRGITPADLAVLILSLQKEKDIQKDRESRG